MEATEVLTIEEAVTQITNAQNLGELSKLDDLFNEADPDLAVVGSEEYRQAFDAAERSLNMVEVEPVVEVQPIQLPTDVSELQKMVLELQAKVSAGPSVKPAARGVQVRAGVSYKILRTSDAGTYTQAQARVILGLIQGFALENKTDVITEAQVAELVDQARAKGFLGGHQPPMRVFRYYMSESMLGYKARGFLSKV